MVIVRITIIQHVIGLDHFLLYFSLFFSFYLCSVLLHFLEVLSCMCTCLRNEHKRCVEKCWDQGIGLVFVCLFVLGMNKYREILH